MNGEGFYIRDGIVVIPKSSVIAVRNSDIAARRHDEDKSACVAVLCTLLAGCYFDHPLTGGPSKDINSWLLGVWEHKDAKGRTYRARVVPITRGPLFREFSAPSGARRLETKRFGSSKAGFRVSAYSRFLSLKCNVSSGEVPEGGFVFVNYQVIDQNTVIIRPLELDSPPEAASSANFARKCAND